MALNEDERHQSDELDRGLSEDVDGYEPPSEEALEEWRTEAPHPSEAVDYDAAGTDSEPSFFNSYSQFTSESDVNARTASCSSRSLPVRSRELTD